MPSPGAPEPALLGAHCHPFPSLSAHWDQQNTLTWSSLPPPHLCDIYIVPVSEMLPPCQGQSPRVWSSSLGLPRSPSLTSCSPVPRPSLTVWPFLGSTHPLGHRQQLPPRTLLLGPQSSWMMQAQKASPPSSVPQPVSAAGQGPSSPGADLTSPRPRAGAQQPGGQTAGFQWCRPDSDAVFFVNLAALTRSGMVVPAMRCSPVAAWGKQVQGLARRILWRPETWASLRVPCPQGPGPPFSHSAAPSCRAAQALELRPTGQGRIAAHGTARC